MQPGFLNCLQDGVIWPVLLLYQQYGQSDVVQAFCDEDMIAEDLAAVFSEEGLPAPWDESFEYRCAGGARHSMAQRSVAY